MIYIGVLADEESLYYIHYVIEVDEDIDIKYTKLGDGTKNDFILTKDNPYQLLSFS